MSLTARVVPSIVLAGMLLVFGPGTAAAKCGDNVAEASPSPHTAVPLDPHIFLFIPPGTASPPTMTVTLDDAPVPYRITLRSQSEAANVFEVAVAARRDGQLEITFADLDLGSLHYVVARYPVSHAAAVTAVEHVASRRTCSFTQAIALTVRGDAVAYYLEWGAQPADLRRGSVERTWLNGFTYGRRPWDLPHTSRVLIGHLSCRGYNLPPEALATPRPSWVVAVFADGTEAVIFTGLLHLGPLEERDDDHHTVPGFDPDPAPPLIEDGGPCARSLALFTAAIGGWLALGAAVALALRRRHRP
jgi:hypothetical protein